MVTASAHRGVAHVSRRDCHRPGVAIPTRSVPIGREPGSPSRKGIGADAWMLAEIGAATVHVRVIRVGNTFDIAGTAGALEADFAPEITSSRPSSTERGLALVRAAVQDR